MDSNDNDNEKQKRLPAPITSPAMLVMPHGWKAKITAKKRSDDGEPVLLFKLWHPAMPDCTAFMEFPVSKLIHGLNINISEMMAAAFQL